MSRRARGAIANRQAMRFSQLNTIRPWSESSEGNAKRWGQKNEAGIRLAGLTVMVYPLIISQKNP